MLVNSECYWVRYCAECAQHNDAIFDQFLHLPPDQVRHRSHFFHDRYENIYIADGAIPPLTLVMQQARQFAAAILATDAETLKLGYWFNYMQPGELTIPHRHDDDDELLAGVYYVRVPPQSGNLVLHDGDALIPVTPQAGNFVCFRPDQLHEVSKNTGQQARLSIGINFGPR